MKYSGLCWIDIIFDVLAVEVACQHLFIGFHAAEGHDRADCLHEQAHVFAPALDVEDCVDCDGDDFVLKSNQIAYRGHSRMSPLKHLFIRSFGLVIIYRAFRK